MKVSTSQSYAVCMHQVIHIAMLLHHSAHAHPSHLSQCISATPTTVHVVNRAIIKRICKRCVPGSFPPDPTPKSLGTRLQSHMLLTGSDVDEGESGWTTTSGAYIQFSVLFALPLPQACHLARPVAVLLQKLVSQIPHWAHTASYRLGNKVALAIHGGWKTW